MNMLALAAGAQPLIDLGPQRSQLFRQLIVSGWVFAKRGEVASAPA
jgi:hypothetical protein